MTNIPYTHNCAYHPHYNVRKFDGMTDLNVWLSYKNALTKCERDEALDELYVRHDKMFIQLARNMASCYPKIGTLDDFLQSARLGAMQAYDNYDTNKSGTAKLSTYVYSCVYHRLLTSRDADWFIPCPAQKKAIRIYLNGGYNNKPDKKTKFEEKYNICTEDDIKALREKYKLIAESEIVSLDSDYINDSGEEVAGAYAELIEDDSALKEDNIILNMRLNETKQKLPVEKQEVFNMFFVEEFKMGEIAEQLKIPVKNVKDDILYIRKHFKRNMKDIITV